VAHYALKLILVRLHYGGGCAHRTGSDPHRRYKSAINQSAIYDDMMGCQSAAANTATAAHVVAHAALYLNLRVTGAPDVNVFALVLY
jgi:hypothetical protein